MAPVNRLTILMCVFLLSVLRGIDGRGREGLILETQDTSPSAGSAVSLYCHGYYPNERVDFGTVGCRIVWLRDDQPVGVWYGPNVTALQQFDVTGELQGSDVFHANLDITSMEVLWNGVYECRLQVESQDGTVEVLETSPSIEVITEHAPSSVYPRCSVLPTAGENLLTCRSEKGSPPVELTWKKGGQLLVQFPFDDGNGFVEARSTISAEYATNPAAFECSLRYNGVPTGSCFLDRPNVTMYIETSHLEVGQEFAGYCLDGNVLKSTLTWKFDPELRNGMGSYNTELDGGVIRVFNITARDNGTRIICEGTNALGSSRASTFINLRQPALPVVEVSLEQTLVPAEIGGLAKFVCRTSPRADPPRPCVWLFEETFVNPRNTKDRFFVDYSSDSSILTVLNVSEADIGASVSCQLQVLSGYQPIKEVLLKADFPKNAVIPTSKGGMDSVLIYVIGGMMCVVLLGVCFWVLIRAKAVLCHPANPDTKENTTRCTNELTIDIPLHPNEVKSLAGIDAALAAAKQRLLEGEPAYQDLEEISRQRLNNEYQREISNEWISVPLTTF